MSRKWFTSSLCVCRFCLENLLRRFSNNAWQRLWLNLAKLRAFLSDQKYLTVKGNSADWACAMPRIQSVFRVVGLCDRLDQLKETLVSLKTVGVFWRNVQKEFLIPTICRYVIFNVCFWVSLTVYASVPLHVVYTSVPLREQTCHDFWGESVDCTQLSCLENFLADGKLHGQVVVFVGGNQFVKLENFKFRNFLKWTRKTGWLLFLNNRKMWEEWVFLSLYFESDLIRTESKPQNIVAVPVRRLPWLFRVLVVVLFKTYLIKSCLEGVNLNGNRIFVFGQILVEMTEILWIPTFTELGRQAKL